jgi:hypothetical protein
MEPITHSDFFTKDERQKDDRVMKYSTLDGSTKHVKVKKQATDSSRKEKKRWLLLLVAMGWMAVMLKVRATVVGCQTGGSQPKRPSVQGKRNATSVITEGVTTLARTEVSYKFSRARLEQPSDVIIGVLSAAFSFKLRRSIRSTWALHRQNVFFIVAGNWTARLQKEMMLQQDLLWFDTPETHRDLTYKSLGFLHVVSTHAKDYQLAFKTDDDTYINMNIMNEMLEKHKEDDYFGACVSDSPLIRDPKHKWYVREEDFPRRNENDTFGPYGMGGGYGISKRALVTDCVRANIANISFIPIEDATTGEILSRCGAKCVLDKQVMKEFQDMRNRSSSAHLAVHEIKFPEIVRNQHVEFCLDYPRSTSCKDFDVSCADPVKRSATCTTEHFVHCGGVLAKDSCSSCPVSQSSINPKKRWCNGDCHWCPRGAVGDGNETGGCVLYDSVCRNKSTV